MPQSKPKTFHYAVEVDRGGRLSVAGGASIEAPEGWSPDHLLLAALVRCSTDTPRTNEVDDLLARAERDCFVSASLTIEPTFQWRIV